MYDNGIRFINDLMKENGKFYKLEELKNKKKQQSCGSLNTLFHPDLRQKPTHQS